MTTAITVELPTHVRLSRKSALVRYAEELGVTSFWDEIQKIQSELDAKLHEHANLMIHHDSVKGRVAARELTLTEGIYESTPEMSGAQRDREIKRCLDNDEKLAEVHAELQDLVDKKYLLDYQIESLRRQHRGMLAQMNVLGNYFSVLSAVKDGNNIGRLLGQDNGL